MTADLGHQLSWDRGKAIANVRTQTRLLAGGSLRNSQVRAGASDGHRGDVALLSFGGRVGGVDLAEGVGRRDAILETCVCVLGGGGGVIELTTLPVCVEPGLPMWATQCVELVSGSAVTPCRFVARARATVHGPWLGRCPRLNPGRLGTYGDEC